MGSFRKQITEKEIPVENLHHRDVVWACAFDMDADRHKGSCSITHLHCRPVKGVILAHGYDYEDESGSVALWHRCEFAILDKNDKPRKSGRVYLHSRRFIKTYEDCIELYNELISQKISTLLNVIVDLEKK